VTRGIINDKNSGITSEHLKSRMTYDQKLGTFTWLNGKCSGKIAGRIETYGYVVIYLKGRLYRAHRLAFLYMTGNWPDYEVDHIDGNRSNNSWSNLRQATRSKNNMNKKWNGKNLKGAHWDYRTKKWCATLKINKKSIWLGRHDTEKEAHNAYIKAAYEHFGEFARAS